MFPVNAVKRLFLCLLRKTFLNKKNLSPQKECWDRLNILRCHPAWYKNIPTQCVLTYAGLCLRRAISVSHTQIPSDRILRFREYRS